MHLRSKMTTEMSKSRFRLRNRTKQSRSTHFASFFQKHVEFVEKRDTLVDFID